MSVCVFNQLNENEINHNFDYVHNPKYLMITNNHKIENIFNCFYILLYRVLLFGISVLFVGILVKTYASNA